MVLAFKPVPCADAGQDHQWAVRSIVRQDSGEGHQEFLTRLAKESGIATRTREHLARLDKAR